jgi:hypothetical protein
LSYRFQIHNKDTPGIPTNVLIVHIKPFAGGSKPLCSTTITNKLFPTLFIKWYQNFGCEAGCHDPDAVVLNEEGKGFAPFVTYYY